MSLNHRVVLITGAAGGLGQVVTKAMADNAARLALIGRSLNRLESLASSLNLSRERYLGCQADLSDPQAVDSVVQAVLEKFGRLDIILHLVGGWVGGRSVVDLDPTEISDMLQQHAWSTFHVAQKFLPHLVANHWGRFIVVSSPSATRPSAKGAPYAMGKAAQQALILTLAQELKGTGVTANILSVKVIDVQHARENSPSAANASWAFPEEIAAAMLYLCSQEASLVNGAVIPIYGEP